MNVHFKTPTAGYAEMFEQMVADGTISTRGLKADADKFTGLLEKSKSLTATLTLVTHDSQISCQEIREFGGASEEQARKIEALWQEIMGAYLPCCVNSEWIRAEHSSHYIHLTDPDLICRLV